MERTQTQNFVTLKRLIADDLCETEWNDARPSEVATYVMSVDSMEALEKRLSHMWVSIEAWKEYIAECLEYIEAEA